MELKSTEYGASGDAYHIAAPAEDGAGGAAAMREALRSWVEPRRGDYINAHGTSTPRGDMVETMVVKSVLATTLKMYPYPVLNLAPDTHSVLRVVLKPFYPSKLWKMESFLQPSITTARPRL